MSGLDSALLKFALEHTDFSDEQVKKAMSDAGGSQLNNAEYVEKMKWLREVMEATESCADRMKRLLYLLRDEGEKDIGIDVPDSEKALGLRATEEAQQLRVLDQILMLVEDIDNANDFVKIGGVKRIIKLCNRPQEAVAASAFSVVAAIVQSNETTQKAFMGEEFVMCLMSNLKKVGEKEGKEEKEEKEKEERKRLRLKVVGCVSALTSDFPKCVDSFLKMGVAEILVTVLQAAEEAADGRSMVRVLYLYKRILNRLDKAKGVEKAQIENSLAGLPRTVLSSMAVPVEAQSVVNLREKGVEVLSQMLRYAALKGELQQAAVGLAGLQDLQATLLASQDEYDHSLAQKLSIILKVLGH